VSVAIVLVAVVLLGGIVVVAMGRGGELSRETSDEPAAADFTSWADVAGYRPPAALLGYHAGATERALQLISRSIAERDAEIAWLRGRLRDLQPEGTREHGQPLDPAGAAASAGPAGAAFSGPASAPLSGPAGAALSGPTGAPRAGEEPPRPAQVGQGTAARSADDA
jgi:hypothetical protein